MKDKQIKTLKDLYLNNGASVETLNKLYESFMPNEGL